MITGTGLKDIDAGSQLLDFPKCPIDNIGEIK
jgi:hypothetical protein